MCAGLHLRNDPGTSSQPSTDAIAYHELEFLAFAQTSCFKISLDYPDLSYTLTLYCNSYQNSIQKSLLTRVEVFLS